jgi:glycerophosphoryl diester phosphodiesterase
LINGFVGIEETFAMARTFGLILCLFFAGLGCQTGRSIPVGRITLMEIIAHRGASSDAPENTLSSVKLGWQQKADAVEVDIYLTKERQIVVMHDGNTKRVAGVDKPVVEQTLAELKFLDVGRWKGQAWSGEKIPTLAEVLATIPKEKRMLVEIKCGPEILPELKQVVGESGKSPEQIAFISFSMDVCAAVKKQMPEHRVYFLSGFSQNEKTHAWTPTAEELITSTKKAGIDGVDLACAEPLDRKFISEIKAEGLAVYVWTVDDPDVARRMKDAGVDGITTNRPAFLRERLQ